MLSKIFSYSLLAAILAIGATSALAQRRNITEKDLFDFIWIGDPQISPDGARVAFVRVTVNEKKDGYDTSIWTVATAGEDQPHQLTNGKHDSSPRWSPDGKFLVFLRATEKDGKPEPAQLQMLPLEGGDSFAFTDLPKGVSNPNWSPDGKTIVFSSTTNAEDLKKQEKKKRKEKEEKQAAAASSPEAAASPNKRKKQDATPTPSPDNSGGDSEHESDIHVITRAVYRSDDDGYLDPKHRDHLWIVAAPHSADEKVQPKQITFGRFEEGNPLWAKDGSKIYFTSLHVDEPYYDLPKTELYSIPGSGGEATRITTFDMDVGRFSLRPDGRQIAFVASTTRPVNSYTQPDLWVCDLTSEAKPRNLTGTFDYIVGSGVFGDNAPPRAGGGGVPVWTPDGKSLIDVYGKEGRTILARFDAKTGAPTDLTNGNQAVVRFRVSEDGAKIVYTLSTATRLNELFAINNAGREPRQLTHLNDKLFSQLNLTEPEEIWYQSFDRKKIQAWVQKPPDFDNGKKYPLILDIHGGPHAAYGYIFEHEFQWMAAKGYVVLYPNPRGSTTYGQEFGNIIQYHYPGDDYKDLMLGVDELVRRGYIDDQRLGVTGGSGGGLLTDWIVGQTTRFAAAVAQRDIAHWADWWYTADFTLFQPNWFKAPPFRDEADFRARSPITYIKNVQTPMMFILGEKDYRTPPDAGGEQMFRALKFRKIPTVMVSFPNETHELSRSGQPWHRVERLQHIVGWFDKWLMGMAKPEYDVAPGEPLAKPNQESRQPPP